MEKINEEKFINRLEKTPERTKPVNLYVGSSDQPYDNYTRGIITPEGMHAFFLRDEYLVEQPDKFVPGNLVFVFNEKYEFFNKLFENEAFVNRHTMINMVKRVDDCDDKYFSTIFEDFLILAHKNLIYSPYDRSILDSFVYNSACKTRYKILKKLKPLDLYFISFMASELPEIAQNYRIIRKSET